jgi:S-DNA-T family DNA segregation ATPase FtsK/SpoIIIE
VSSLKSLRFSETPAFDTPLVQEFIPDDEPLDEEEFDDEFTVEVPVVDQPKATLPSRPAPTAPAHQMILAADTPYQLPRWIS